DWNDLFEGYQATVDWPGCTFYAELMEVYPDAKVLLTVRDPDSWYESAKSTIYQTRGRTAGSPIESGFSAVMRRLVPNVQHIMNLTRILIWEKTFGGNFEDKQHAIAVFHKH